MDALPLLSLLIITLPLGALLLWLLPQPAMARWGALAVTLLVLLLSLLVVARFDSGQTGFQLVEQYRWIPSLNIHYLVGVDELSLLFLPLTALLFVGIIVASWNTVRTMRHLYFTLLLLQLGATLGVFLALDTILFFLFWELSLIPLYFLVSLWGSGVQRRYAATKYTLVMLGAGIPLLFGFVMLAFNHAALAGVAAPAGLAFDLPTLLQTPLPRGLSISIFLLLFVGFAAKTPLVPLHSWLPVMAMEGPVAVTAMLVGLKLGAYGIIRFAVPLAPEGARELHWLLAALGTLGILYGALGAIAQTNLRRMLAYSSVSHVGMVVLGIASFSVPGLQGAVLHLLNFTLVAGGGFLLLAFLHNRTGSSDLADLGGVAQRMPLLAGLFLLFGLAGLGVPGTSGFPAELLIILSAIKSHTGAGLAALFAMVVAAGYFMGGYRRAFLGVATNPAIRDAEDLLPRERWYIFIVAALILLVGFYPSLILDLLRPAAEVWVARLG